MACLIGNWIAGPVYRSSSALIWLAESVNIADWREVTVLAIALAAAFPSLGWLCQPLDQLRLGDQSAQAIGLNVGGTRMAALILSVLLTAAAVSVVGGIGFVGLIAPHAARLLFGTGTAPQMFGAALIGMAMVVGADLIVRAAFQPLEVPAGALTALIGAPYFLFLLIRRGPVPMSDTLIEVSNGAIGYRDTLVFEDFSLSIEKGRITTLSGPNGCGKSTLLSAMRGALPLSKGQILLDQSPIGGWSAKALARQIASLGQTPSAPEEMRVRDLVALGRYSHQSAFRPLSAIDHTTIADVIDDADVTELADRPIAFLSGGQVQRAWLAMVIAQEAPTIFLDEPTNHLDISHARRPAIGQIPVPRSGPDDHHRPARPEYGGLSRRQDAVACRWRVLR